MRRLVKNNGIRMRNPNVAKFAFVRFNPCTEFSPTTTIFVTSSICLTIFLSFGFFGGMLIDNNLNSCTHSNTHPNQIPRPVITCEEYYN